ncbi:TonB-dependent receptor [Dasania sp. GY-MA-18]|uniref:TonB-dependent receptor n=1 Tax=Dasania phycosphaerae TaxID=2950436 RepID=A0A9J6RPK9_9GAMM|nr:MULTISPECIES: TonB-dependent receptor [Dasania]MCR8924081.1 TonB-dependent receptor [Dasania sp. GY-MA-18]MCZ0866654.1 TonB-dependent receptor [Dasania phycosphaerae]MCZ0870239.1 TonB-dependent receptor [Dasania phycosphaerae]
MNKTYNKHILGVSIALLSAGITATGANAAQLEELLVTASKKTQSVQDVPYNISAMTGNDLEAKGVSDLTKLSRAVPGLTFSDRGARAGLISSGLVIRGINAEDARANRPNTNVPVISTYINETPIFTNIRLTDIERVEILRGPQGTLYGSGSLGGTLRYIQREPNPDQFEAKISGEINQVNHSDDLGWKTDLMLNIPLADDLAVRINLGKEDQAGFVDQNRLYQLDSNGAPLLADPSDIVNSPGLFTSKDDVNDSDIENARIHFMLQTDNATINLAHHYQKTTSGGSQMIGATSKKLDSPVIMLETYEGESNLTSLDVEYDLGFATLTTSLSTYESENSGISDQTALYENFSFYNDYYGSGPRPFVSELSIWNEEANIAEVRLVSESETNLDWAVGAFYMDQDSEIGIEDSYFGYTDYANACFDNGGPFGGVPCGYGSLFGVYANNGPLAITESNKDLAFLALTDNNFKDKAIYGELTYHFTDEWQVTLGGRWFDQKYVSDAVSGLAYVPGLVFGGNEVFEEKDALFKFNTSYDINEDTMTYFTVTEGFRRGGANALGGAITEEEARRYDSDHTTNYELGIKGNIDRYYNYTVAAFYVDWKDIQLNSTCGILALICVVNAGDAESQGIEAQIEGNVSDNLSISASYTYAKAELVSLNPTLNNYTTFIVEEGMQLPQSPKQSASWGATYTLPLENGMDVAYHLGGTYRGKSESRIDDQNVSVDAFTLWDAYVSLTSDQWNVRLFVDNITDEIGITGELTELQWGREGARANISRPRTVGLAGSYSF